MLGWFVSGGRVFVVGSQYGLLYLHETMAGPYAQLPFGLFSLWSRVVRV